MTVKKIFLHRFNPTTIEIEIEYLDALHIKNRVKVSSDVLETAQHALTQNSGQPVVMMFNPITNTFVHR
mgnify:CR=1 FL=1